MRPPVRMKLQLVWKILKCVPMELILTGSTKQVTEINDLHIKHTHLEICRLHNYDDIPSALT